MLIRKGAAAFGVSAAILGGWAYIHNSNPEAPTASTPDQASSSSEAERVIGMLGECVTGQYDIHRRGQPATASMTADGVVTDKPADPTKEPFSVIEVSGQVFAYDLASRDILDGNLLGCDVVLYVPEESADSR